MKMEEKDNSLNTTTKRDGVNLGISEEWLWATASIAQLGWGITAFKKGYAGNSKLMPVKAFAVASLFVGAAATATFGALRAAGIRKVKDMKEVGANIRTSLGVPPRNKAE